jgi:choline dehydrogenase-like flavoprotein
MKLQIFKILALMNAAAVVSATTATGAAPIANLNSAHATESKAVVESYDYIITGGGLAGCLLADRLSADGKKVLVLEAGSPDYNSMLVRIPAGILRLFRNNKYDWQHETGGEKACNGRNVFLQRGKGLGGSSCTNVCLHHRGSAQDYDDWGVPGWKASDVLPFFKATQKDMTGRTEEYHGKDGDWVMDEVRYQNPLSKRFLEVGAKAGLGTNDDFNNWSRPQDGVGRYSVSEINGERCSGAKAFISKALKRKNCNVRTGTMVRRINFDGSKTARSVTYDLVGDDTCTKFEAKLNEGGEVIVTSGAIASPQLLMCSGIGPADHLKDHGIPVVHDNPYVGQNLQDHPAAVVSFKTPKKGVSVTSKLRLFGKTNPFPIIQWLLFKTGLLTSTGCDHGAFVRTAASSRGQPDLQIRFLAARALGPDGMTTFSQFRNAKSLEDGYSFQSVACRAKSKGCIRLASSNTHVKPSIDGGYLNDASDLKTLREGIKLGRQLGNRPEWGEFLGEEVYPGIDVQTDAQIDEYIKNTIHTANALTGTCKMGVGKDAVVGPDLKVIGVNGVRVADSSTIPVIPGGQTATPTVMIAERAAAFLRSPQQSVTTTTEVIMDAEEPAAAVAA